MTTLTQDQAITLEQQHNVCIDIDNMQYNNDSYDATYGWLPIPQKWIDAVNK